MTTHAATAVHANPVPRPRVDARAWRRFVANRGAMISLVFLGVFILLLVGEPWVNPHDPLALTERQLQPPTVQHWFGTDGHGRDLLSRSFYGCRISLAVGLVGAGVSLVIGVAWGATAGFLGGRWDQGMMRAVDALYATPSLIFLMVLLTAVDDLIKRWAGDGAGAGWVPQLRLLCLFVGLGSISWLTMARIVRGQVLSLRSRPFVDASRVLGASQFRILWRHVLPNLMGVVVTYGSLTLPAIILYESFLSYLGLGVQPPHASLGSLLAEGAGQINPIQSYWWTLCFPGGMMVSLLLALNFVSDGLRDAFDTRA